MVKDGCFVVGKVGIFLEDLFIYTLCSTVWASGRFDTTLYGIMRVEDVLSPVIVSPD